MRAIYVALVAMWVGASAPGLYASPIAFDTAGDSAYNNFNPNSTTYPNGGYGWGGPWQSNGALFVNEPGLTGPGHPADTTPINSPMTPDGRAWGLSYFLGEQLAWAQRPFLGALSPGQIFSMDLDMRAVSIPQYGEGNSQFITLGPVGQGPVGYGVELEASPPGNYRVDVIQPGTPYATYTTDIPASDQFVHLDIAVIDGSNVRVTLTSLGDDGGFASLVVPDSVPITNLTMANQGVGDLPDAEIYFNNIEITPEPTGILLPAIVVAGALLSRRRLAA